MPKPILIVQNNQNEGPALMQDILKERGLDCNIINLNNVDAWPDVQNYGAVIVLGGPDSANDENEKMQTELKQIQKILQHKIPYLGICLGLQTLVKAAGGAVFKNPIKEIGFRDPDDNFFTVDLTEAGQRDPLFTGLSKTLKVFQLHGETVQPTEDMQVLGTGKFCQNQAVRVGQNAYGLQFHCELNPALFSTCLNSDSDLQKLDKDQLQADFASIKEEYDKVGQQLFSNFLQIAGY